jgi:hypothetical protein
MTRIAASISVGGLASEAESLWYDPQRWASWVDGFGHVVRIEGEWPRAGARLVWDSPPGGRGRVAEQVMEYEPRSGQSIEIEDERLHGTQRVTFEPLAEGVKIRLELSYELKQANPFTPLTDFVFIRRALRDSLRRSLARFARERRADFEL